MLGADGVSGGLDDKGRNGIRVVGHGDVSAAGQYLDAGAGRKLVQVAGLAPEQQPVA
jgi:hypothetical protein